MFGLDTTQIVHQNVVLRVADIWLIEHVIHIVGSIELFAKVVDSLGQVEGSHIVT